MPKKTPKYWNEAKVAEELGVDIKTVAGWRQRKKGPPYHKFEGAVRYKPEEVISYKDANRVVHA